ncbi:MAG TPA: hypothetical protein VN317_10800 [Candidatus Methanoperedens sp.]|nr:hypothetical protein [Candidatus Methanoperedens sp.]
MGRALMIPGMVGSRNFNLSTITRQDLMSLTEECEKATGIPYVMRACRKEYGEDPRAATQHRFVSHRGAGSQHGGRRPLFR